MAEKTEPTQDTANEELVAKPSTKKRLIKIIILVVMALVIVPATYFPAKFLVRYIKEKQAAAKLKESVEDKQKPFGEIYTLKDLTVNTAGSRGRRFAIIELSIEISKEGVVEEITKREPEIRDALINYLRDYSDIEMTSLTFQRESKTELVHLINDRLHTGMIDSVYYTKLLIQ